VISLLKPAGQAVLEPWAPATRLFLCACMWLFFVIPITATQHVTCHQATCSVAGEKLVSKVEHAVSGKNEPIWPAVIIVFVLSLTTVWVGMLGSSLIQLIDYML
jgi:hypothetical protein